MFCSLEIHSTLKYIFCIEIKCTWSHHTQVSVKRTINHFSKILCFSSIKINKLRSWILHSLNFVDIAVHIAVQKSKESPRLCFVFTETEWLGVVFLHNDSTESDRWHKGTLWHNMSLHTYTHTDTQLANQKLDCKNRHWDRVTLLRLGYSIPQG